MNERIILVVEDDSDDEVLILRAFKRNNVANEVVVVRDGTEALEYLFCTGAYAGREPCANPQLILLDLKLPGMNGRDLCQEFKSGSPDIPIIVVSASCEVAEKVLLLELALAGMQ